MNNADHRSSGAQHIRAVQSQGPLSTLGEKSMQSQLRLVILITATIFFCELLVMLILYLLEPLPIWLNAAIDAVLLIILISPVLYFGLFRTLIKHIEDCRQIEEALKRELKINTTLSNELEQRVEERTQKLKLSNENLKKEIAERKHAEERLRQTKSNLKAVFNAISDPLVLMEKNLTVKMFNSSAARYYGLSGRQDIRPDNMDAKCHKLVAESSTPCYGCVVPQKFANGKGVTFERQGFMEKDRLEQVFLYPVVRKESRDSDILMRISDITEQRMMERQLVHNEKMASLGVLVSSVAHEINNPNSFISFNIPILRDFINEMLPIVDAHAETHPDLEIGNMNYPDFRRDILNLLDNVEHGSRRISTFVSNLKDFSRFKSEVREEWVDLRQVIEKVAAICSARLKNDVESFTIEMPEVLPRIWSDAAALEQVLLNLLINAAQAVEKIGSRVRLAVDIRNRWIDHTILEVSDNGTGINEETRKKIFDPFFTTKSREEGVGLGLYVCHNLVERLRGRIEIETQPGKGSTFRVILPDRERRSQKRL